MLQSKTLTKNSKKAAIHVSITHMNNLHNDCLRALDFYKQEIAVLKERLTEIAGKNSNNVMLKQVEHYENQFKIQIDNIERLRHFIRSNISGISKELKSSKVPYVKGELLAKHNQLLKEFSAEEKVINEMRHDFNRFASIWM